MLPAAVSIRMLACPVPVTRTSPYPHVSADQAYGENATGPAGVDDPRRRGRARLQRAAFANEEDVVADSHEEVVAPDQLKPGHRRSGRFGAIVVAVSLLLMIFCNNEVTGTARLWLISIAVLLILAVVGDSVLRRNGLRSKD
jgi:hypothetical protein